MCPHSVNVSSQTLSSAEHSERMHLPGMGLRGFWSHAFFYFDFSKHTKTPVLLIVQEHFCLQLMISVYAASILIRFVFPD